ncbi:hypothetical protein M446_2449 [Methylobacterium sp. 4-46]|uniref:DUF7336 domain-containing protein n=1 Tax=unclassified Methylobacterium TaxID=2615210 RepID=UPI000165C838|nr:MULTISPECIES: hypothetical protein [Methylobacterium]ACA16902.1 hypothetical protein M446_2449 [Methylobacterium sp. 4-46]WFT82591.1 hypothetical protein QA634_12400 [Methylobacterium nodulans]
MNSVFVVHHTRELEGTEEYKFIGVFSSEKSAKDAVLKLSMIEGFREYVDGFSIDRYEVDNISWQEGFVEQ